MKNIYGIYSRKSKFTGKGESIDNQIEICKKYINDNFTENNKEVYIYEDEGFSGKDTIRPNFQKMMQDARAHKFKAIVCYRLDRISRNIGDFANLLEELNDNNTAFISVKESFDTNSPIGRAMMYIVSVFSQLERETIAERIRDNMYELSKTGRWLGGTCPIGYKSELIESVDKKGKIRKEYKLELIPDEANIVKLIYNKYLETKSLSKTETYLILNNYKTRMGKEFGRFAIKTILSNPVYMIADEDAYNYIKEKNMNLYSYKENFNGENGIIAYNKTKQKDKKSWRYKDCDEWIVAVGKHQGIIDGKTWIEVQNILEGNKSKGYKNPRSNLALLSGVLFCRQCGDYMRPKSYKKRGPNNERYYYYLCMKKEVSRGKLCNIKNPHGNKLDEYVIDEIKKIATPNSEFLASINKYYKKISDRKFDWTIRESSLNQELQNKRNQINTLLNTLSEAQGEAAYKYIIDKINQLDQEVKILEDEINKSNINQINEELYNEEFSVLVKSLKEFSSAIDNATFEQKKNLIRNIIKRVEWDGENIHIYFFNSDEADMVYPKTESDTYTDILTPECEDSKCYTINTETLVKSNTWVPIKKINKDFYIMMYNNSNNYKYSPLYIHNCKINNCFDFNLLFDKYNNNSNSIPFKLKYLRKINNMTQKEVAGNLNVNIGTIKNYEHPEREIYPLPHLIKLSEIYNCPLENILDEYHMFLYKGPGKQIHELRKKHLLTQQQFADIFGVHKRTVLTWEKDRAMMSKEMWKQIKEKSLT